MHVAVVVVTFNSRADLGGLLDSIPERAGAHGLDLVIVDSGSTDDSLGVAAGLRPDATLVDLGANRGYAAGVNAGWEAAGGADVLLLLNPDLTVDEGVVGPWIDSLGDGVGIVVPRIRNLDGALEPSLRRRPTPLRAWAESLIGGHLAGRLGLGELVPAGDVYTRPAVAGWASGAAMAISAACLADVGAWDERFFLYSEETDFCLRAAAAGYSTRLEPRAGVIHRGGDFAVSPPLYALMTWNRVRLQRKHSGSAAAVALAAGVLAGELIRGVTGPQRTVHRTASRVLVSRRSRPTLLPPSTDLAWNGAD
ncbi:MAG: glycosyltransferase family 2 protein [Acidimicrobiales bacterium]